VKLSGDESVEVALDPAYVRLEEKDPAVLGVVKGGVEIHEFGHPLLESGVYDLDHLLYGSRLARLRLLPASAKLARGAGGGKTARCLRAYGNVAAPHGADLPHGLSLAGKPPVELGLGEKPYRGFLYLCRASSTLD